MNKTWKYPKRRSLKEMRKIVRYFIQRKISYIRIIIYSRNKQSGRIQIDEIYETRVPNKTYKYGSTLDSILKKVGDRKTSFEVRNY